MIKKFQVKQQHFLTSHKTKPSSHVRAEQARKNVQRRLDLETAHAVFAHVDGGLFKAFLDRLQMSALRAHEPLSMESLAVAVRILGNIRVDRFKLVDRACGLARIISLFMATLSRAQLMGLRAELARHFEATRHAVKTAAANKGSGTRSGRVLFVDVTPMRPGELGLEADWGENTNRRYVGPLTRITMLKGNNQITHACIRTKETPRSALETEAEVFAAAKAHGKPEHPEGLFVCEPAQACPHGTAPELPLTLKAVDPIETTAAFIVQASRAFRKGDPIVVTVADFTGVIDPVGLKQAILSYPIKTKVLFAYLPCASSIRG